MGTNKFGEIEELSRIVRPDGAILTGIAESHLEFLRNTEGVAREKAGIIRGMPPGAPLVIPSGMRHEDLVRRLAEKSGVRIVRFRIDCKAGEPAEHELKVLEKNDQSLSFKLFGIEYRMSPINPLQLRNLTAGMVLLREQGIDADRLREAASGIEFSVSGRFEWKSLGDGWLVDDSYNANPGSFRSVLDAIDSMHPKVELTVVAGPMAELGERSATLHREVGEMLFVSGCNRLFVLGGDSGKGYLEGWRKAGGNNTHAVQFENLPELFDAFLKSWSASEVVLVKGSRSARMERFVEAILNPDRKLRWRSPG